MRDPVFCICDNKDVYQLRDNRAADQCLCFHYIDSTCTIPLLSKSRMLKPLAILSSCVSPDTCPTRQFCFFDTDCQVVGESQGSCRHSAEKNHGHYRNPEGKNTHYDRNIR